MAEQRHGPLGPHQGRFYDEDDDLLALSSDDEDGITDAPSYVPIITVLGALRRGTRRKGMRSIALNA